MTSGIASRRLLALVMPVVILAGCGTSSSPSFQQPVGQQTISSTVTQRGQVPQTATQVAQDRGIGSQALLRLSDFPAGWTAGPGEPRSKNESHLEQLVVTCLHVTVAQLGENNPAEAKSPKFKGTSGNVVSSSVTVWPSEDAAAKVLAVVEKPETPSCLTKALSYELSHPEAGQRYPRGVTIGSPTVEPMSFPSMGTQSIAYRISVQITTPIVRVPFFEDAVMVRVGRADASFNFRGSAAPLSANAEEALTELSVQRLGKLLKVACSRCQASAPPA
jgi:hypothetical protein